jgi:N-acetyl-gamma-glutamyl-phosphate reductase
LGTLVIKSSKKMKNAGIIGAAGYTGGELIRLLLKHPFINLQCVQSTSQAGLKVTSKFKDLIGETDLVFSEKIDEKVDVLFLCLAHGDSKKWLQSQKLPSSMRIIDLSQDYRLGGNYAGRDFVYGLPEANRNALKSAELIANPGCFATGIQLSLLPLAAQNFVNQVFTTGVTGSTGAGQGLSETSHFSWRHANVSAYKTLNHQHLHEIKMTLEKSGATNPQINFVPWRGDFPRGIFLSSTLACDLSQNEVFELYENYYEKHPFTHPIRAMIDLKMVVNSNKCVIFPEKVGDFLVVHTALDNLLKGAVGQAVQNMNLMFGWEETCGLGLKGSVF